MVVFRSCSLGLYPPPTHSALPCLLKHATGCPLSVPAHPHFCPLYDSCRPDRTKPGWTGLTLTCLIILPHPIYGRRLGLGPLHLQHLRPVPVSPFLTSTFSCTSNITQPLTLHQTEPISSVISDRTQKEYARLDFRHNIHAGTRQSAPTWHLGSFYSPEGRPYLNQLERPFSDIKRMLATS